MTLFDQPSDAPTRRIIEHLQRHGAATIRDLEGVLGVTTTAVRAHLAGLLADGYVERRAVHQGVGRPHHAYALTIKARELYACHCDDLALTLLQEVFAIEGPARAAFLLERVGTRLAQRYAGQVRAGTLRERVEQMAGVLQQRGVLTDVETLPAGAASNGNGGHGAHVNGGNGVNGAGGGAFDPEMLEQLDAAGGEVFLLKAYNCPFHELAQEHREICAMDERMLQQVVGADVHLSSCMMDGESRCTFVVRAAAPHAAGGEQGAAHSLASLPTRALPQPQAATTQQQVRTAAGSPAAPALPESVAIFGIPREQVKEGKEGKDGKKKKHKKGR
ncbi:MAG: helix-turn-helix transcriptional regulator [Caldilineaceae bacterium]